MRTKLVMKNLVLMLAGLLSVFWGSPLNAQTAPAKESGKQHLGYGSVMGRVFVITNGGDLKPARFAKVYFFFDAKTSGGKVFGDDDGSVGYFFLGERTKWLEDDMKKAEQSVKQHEDLPSDAVMCLEKLSSADKEIVDTLDYAQKTQHLSEIYVSDTDEEGNFRIDKFRPGFYVVIARGQAGIDDVFWHEDIIIEPKGSFVMKLHLFDAACTGLTE
jgi:hypothetical protein